jgi:hypothetical protein
MRTLLILVRSRRRGACSAGGAGAGEAGEAGAGTDGGAEPLADGVRVLVIPAGVTGSVTTGLP